MKNGYLVIMRLTGLMCGAIVKIAMAQYSFDLASDFSASANPNGPWSFGWMSSNSVFFPYSTQFAAYGLALKEWRGTFPSNDGSAPPDVMLNPTDAAIIVSDTTWLPHQVTFHPGKNGEQSVIRWTSPLAGTVRLEAAFEGRSGFATSGIEIYRNNDMLFSGVVSGTGEASRISLNTNLAVQVGSLIDFRVNYGNGNWTSDTTQISALIISVPEPLLEISFTTDSRIRLAWPTNSAGYQLESAKQLPTLAWSPVTNAAVLEGGQVAVILSAANAQEYFRLCKP